ncbi:hypothetical protein L9F63_020196, partial [Diploptera punctata]
YKSRYFKVNICRHSVKVLSVDVCRFQSSVLNINIWVKNSQNESNFNEDFSTCADINSRIEDINTASKFSTCVYKDTYFLTPADINKEISTCAGTNQESRIITEFNPMFPTSDMNQVVSIRMKNSQHLRSYQTSSDTGCSQKKGILKVYMEIGKVMDLKIVTSSDFGPEFSMPTYGSRVLNYFRDFNEEFSTYTNEEFPKIADFNPTLIQRGSDISGREPYLAVCRNVLAQGKLHEILSHGLEHIFLPSSNIWAMEDFTKCVLFSLLYTADAIYEYRLPAQ